MIRIVLSLVFFTVHVESRLSVIDRQWNQEDARENCTNKCQIECVQCLEPATCTEDQTKCGEKNQIVGPDCQKDSICVPSDCECK